MVAFLVGYVLHYDSRVTDFSVLIAASVVSEQTAVITEWTVV
jgi:hypothetical protein